jgi:hypothetical protein
MSYLTVEDGSLFQNSMICSNVILQEQSMLKDCQVPTIFCPPLCLILLDEKYPIVESSSAWCQWKIILQSWCPYFVFCCLKSLGSDCRLGPGYVLGPQMELKGEALAKKEKVVNL